MSSERHRVGYISASDPDELSYDFGSTLPSFLEMVSAAPPEPVRLVTVEALAAAERGLDIAAQSLVESGVQAIIVSIAPMVYVGGHGYDRVIIDRVHDATGLPVTTNQTAAVDALKALGVSRIALLNPNTSDLLAHQVQFFEDSGIHVDVAKSMEIADNRDIDCVQRDTSYEFVKSVIREEDPPEGIYLSGPCWRTLDLIEPLEAELGVPVVTALQAMVWAAARLVDRPAAVKGYGKLLAAS
jgi:maleate cis-trans isomerase